MAYTCNNLNISTNYYPFGMLMPGRHEPIQTSIDNTSAGTKPYRFGFNGKEQDFSMYNSQGNSYDFGARIYNPRLGRFLSVDQLAPSFPNISPYSYSLNNPIYYIDIDGRKVKPASDLEEVVIPQILNQLAGNNTSAKKLFGLTSRPIVVDGKIEHAFGTTLSRDKFKRRLKLSGLKGEDRVTAQSWFDVLESDKIIELVIINSSAQHGNSNKSKSEGVATAIKVRSNNKFVADMLETIKKADDIRPEEGVTAEQHQLNQQVLRQNIIDKTLGNADIKGDRFGFFNNEIKEDRALKNDMPSTFIGVLIVNPSGAPQSPPPSFTYEPSQSNKLSHERIEPLRNTEGGGHDRPVDKTTFDLVNKAVEKVVMKKIE